MPSRNLTSVNWSQEAERFREKVMTQRMENNILTGMPRFVASKAIRAAIIGAEEIAKRTDGTVDVADLRVISIAYIYNTKMALLGPTLTNACEELYCVETGTGPLWDLPNLPCQPCNPVDALKDTGIPPLNCEKILTWIRANSKAIDEALPIAASTAGVSWNAERPLSEAFESTSK